MKVLFRLDASDQIGMGHLSRCLVLADALQQEGAEITFACRQLPGSDLDRFEADVQALTEVKEE